MRAARACNAAARIRPLPSHELLVGAPEVWARARAAIAPARGRGVLQALPVEGAATGLAVADAIGASGAPLRRVAVDDYTRLVINDRWVHTRRSRKDAALQAEVRATAKMFAGLRARGVEVVWTEPVRRLWRDYPFRNHRKMIVVDDVVYLGGINFSAHNFAWTDLMIRIARKDVADLLAADFPRPADASARAWRAELAGVTLYGLDGRSNAKAFAHLEAQVDVATREIVVVSPYLSFPFTDALVRARRRGLHVRIVTPHSNNKPLLRDYIVALSRRAAFEVVQTQEMTHVKALVVDARWVTLGSSNFDFVSYDAEPEIIATFDDPALARALQTVLIRPAMAQAVARPSPVSALAGLRAAGALRLAQGYVRALKVIRGATA